VSFEGDVRAACITTLDAYATAQSVKLQTYRGRPRSIKPPTAFVDLVRETIVYVGHMMQRTVQADVVLLHGLFDSGEATDQRDTFVDGYIDYVRGQVHAAGPQTTLGVVSTEDDPTYVPDWLPREEQRTYFATRITLEGYAGD
jgi:hypothetical protein